jgi:glycosyltransferase involved in cell wall biosynthesis
MNTKPSLGFALIAKDAGKHLEACLKSIRPYCQQIVVAVDELSKDKTERIARRYADTVIHTKVSDWHECPQHGRVLVQHFARARQHSFSALDPNLDFHAWIDADDVLENARLLPSILHHMPEACVGLWSPYLYSTIEKETGGREVNTIFHRERIFKTKFNGKPVDWQWQHRVHEVIVPKNVRSPQWLMNDELRWVHQQQAHKTENSAPRNLLCLEVEMEEDPDDERTLWYLGHSHYACGDHQEAANWYQHFVEKFAGKGNPYNVWQAYIYLSRCRREENDVRGAMQAIFGAIDARPEHPDPYWELAALYAQLEQPEKTIHWTEHADGLPDAPFFAFKNPMDRSFNKWIPLGDAYLQMGNFKECVRCWSTALQAYPDKTVQGRLDVVKARLLMEETAEHFHQLTVTGTYKADQVEAMYEALPDPVKSHARTRNIVMTELRRRREESTQPRIIFWCGQAAEPWAPPSLEHTGIGGSETAVIQIAKRFAAAGWRTDVYTACDWMEGVYDGVGYWDPARFETDSKKCDVFVSWRAPRAWAVPVEAKQKVLWCHDLNYGPDVREDMCRWPIVLGVSQWHADMLERYYGVKAGFVPNGIDLERFAEPVKKVPYRCVYASSPDRGLVRLLSLWPHVLKSEPEAELHVAYGWETMDRMIASGRDDLIEFRQGMEKRINESERVVWRGRLPQAELAKLYQESWLWTYPTEFLEVSCISAMEAMAGGAVPVTTRCGALPETIGSSGLLVPGPSTSRGFQDTYLNVLRGMLLDANQRVRYEAMGRERARAFTWEDSFSKWLSILGSDVAVEQAPEPIPAAPVPDHTPEMVPA